MLHYLKSVKLSTTTLHYLEGKHCDPSKECMVFLHGFPETSLTWEYYLQHMQCEYNVFAPDLPGYNFSEGFTSREKYHVAHLIECVSEFIEFINNGQKVTLVAHDWGGAIAWPLSAFKPHLISKLIILNAAHPSCFTREMLNNPKQQSYSDYISDLISDNAYALYSEGNFARLKALYEDKFDLISEAQKQAFIKQWQDEKSMQNAFSYYKCMPNIVTKRVSDCSGDVSAKIPNIRIEVPCMVLWGMRDKAFVPEVLDSLEQWVKDLTLVKFNQADHWLHHQHPKEILTLIQDYKP